MSIYSCKLCGGTHFGSNVCPFFEQQAAQPVNAVVGATEPCTKPSSLATAAPSSTEKEQPDVLAAERKAVLELARQFARDILISEGFYTRAAVSVAQQFLEADAEREDLRAELDKALEENDAMAKDYLELGRRLEAAQSATRRSILKEVAVNYLAADKPVFEKWLERELGPLDGGNERKER